MIEKLVPHPRYCRYARSGFAEDQLNFSQPDPD
jgi:hypothetical protein